MFEGSLTNSRAMASPNQGSMVKDGHVHFSTDMHCYNAVYLKRISFQNKSLRLIVSFIKYSAFNISGIE